jgi:hypothetical protein
MVDKFNVHSFLVVLRSPGVFFRIDPHGDGQISHHFVHRMCKTESVIQLGAASNCPVSDKQLSEETGEASSRIWQTF